MFAACLLYSVHSSETSVNFYHITLRHIPDDRTFQKSQPVQLQRTLLPSVYFQLMRNYRNISDQFLGDLRLLPVGKLMLPTHPL
jgi:hypothetical protein